MVATGALAMYLLQNALQAGTLVAAQPGITLSDPVVSIAWGVVVFGEPVNTGWWLIGALAGAALIVSGTVALSRSPVTDDDGEAEQGRADGSEREGAASAGGTDRPTGAGTGRPR